VEGGKRVASGYGDKIIYANPIQAIETWMQLESGTRERALPTTAIARYSQMEGML